MRASMIAEETRFQERLGANWADVRFDSHMMPSYVILQLGIGVE